MPVVLGERGIAKSQATSWVGAASPASASTPLAPAREITVTSPHLPPIGQVVLRLERLTGDCISGSYGLQVSDC
jgi:hypothetical protein